MTLPVLILAGSRDGERDLLAQYGDVTHKALLPIAETPMIERVVKALEDTPHLGKIWVSIENPSALTFLKDRIHILPSANSPSESALQALTHIGSPCLITTADHALLSPHWVQDFLEKSHDTPADMTAAVASAACVTRDVPQTKRTFITLSDLTFSGCNLFFAKNNKALNVIKLWNKLQKNRKRPLYMAWTLGVFTLFQFLIKHLSVATLEQRICSITGAQVRLITLDDGRASVDVDKIADFHLVEKILKER